jgi:hypothetical protein
LKIAYITYWSIQEGLSQATSIPNLRILNGFEKVSKIDYYTFEKEYEDYNFFIGEKISHFPLKRGVGSHLSVKIKDYVLAWKQIHANHKIRKYDFVIARSSFSGIFAFFIFLLYRVPFIVESFEPHSEYQINIPGGWSKFGFRYNFLSFFENLQKKYSSFLLPVSNNYKNELIKEGVLEAKVIVQPCCIDYSNVIFNSSVREIFRNKLQIPSDNLVGVYAGKFGGLYYEKEAFDFIGDLNFFLNNNLSIIFLTPNDKDYLIEQLVLRGFDVGRINVLFVKPTEVFSYLMASDFGFNFHISNTVSNYFSPIKNAEYWSLGLPIIIPTGIGDDSEIVNNLEIGLVHDFSEKLKIDQVKKLICIINNNVSRLIISEKTLKFRSIELIRKSYSDIFSNMYFK